MDELQLHDLQNIEAAVDVQKKAIPATIDEASVPNIPARGKDMRRPILVGYGRFSRG
jgi:hypothetical protein